MAQPRPDPRAFDSLTSQERYEKQYDLLPPTQEIPDDEEYEDDPGSDEVPDQDEDEVDERPGSARMRKIVRDSHGPYRTPQRSFRREIQGVVGPYYQTEHQAPDLDDYLSQWDLSDREKVGLCRTYANYLSAKNRSKPTGEKTAHYLEAAAKKQKK